VPRGAVSTTRVEHVMLFVLLVEVDYKTEESSVSVLLFFLTYVICSHSRLVPSFRFQELFCNEDFCTLKGLAKEHFNQVTVVRLL